MFSPLWPGLARGAFPCYIDRMGAKRAIFDQTDAEAAADGRAEAGIRAGRVVDHVEVAAWLAKWGTPDERPAPPEWLA